MKKILLQIIVLSILITAIPTAGFAAESVSAAGNNRAEAIIELMQKQQELKEASVGSRVVFGSYEQDNRTSNGKEEIEWLVLARESDRLLLVSRYALDFQPYNTKLKDTTWETSSIRTWLNTFFLQEAFSADEQKMIPTVTVKPEKSVSYYADVDTGNETQDHVFLLSLSEVKQYFSDEVSRMCRPTDYTQAKGDYYYSKWWWLRTTGWENIRAAAIMDNGKSQDSDEVKQGMSIRPALWIDPGAYIDFGTYEQANDIENGPEPIEWEIVELQGNEALLLSKYALARQPFEDTLDNAVWETSSLRNWLNGSFYSNAFSEEEKIAVLDSAVQALPNPKYGGAPGNNTNDRVFLLSIQEAQEYFSSNEARVCSLNESETDSDGGTACWWWLRTAGNSPKSTAVVNAQGGIVNSGDSSRKTDGGVRPVIRVDIEKLPYAMEDNKPVPAKTESVEEEKAEAEITGLAPSDTHVEKSQSKPGIQRISFDDCVTVGTYVQSDNPGNGAEGIDWIVLDIQGDKALLLSKYGLDPLHYHTGLGETTWETSNARKWLNSTFYENAFSEEEKEMILLSKVTADRNPMFEDTDPGNDTEDYIFLLSIPELTKYLLSDEDRHCEATPAAIAHGAATFSDVYCSWWLRTPGYMSSVQSHVSNMGYQLDYRGAQDYPRPYVIRPAMWVKVDLLPEFLIEYLLSDEGGNIKIDNDFLTVKEENSKLFISLNNISLKEEGYSAKKEHLYSWKVEFEELDSQGKENRRYEVATAYYWLHSNVKSGLVRVEEMAHTLKISERNDNDSWNYHDPVEVEMESTTDSITWIIDLEKTPINLDRVRKFDVWISHWEDNADRHIELKMKDGSVFSVTLNDIELEEDYLNVPGLSEASYVNYDWEVVFEDAAEVAYEVESSFTADNPGRKEKLQITDGVHKLSKLQKNHSWLEDIDKKVKIETTDTSISWLVDSWKLPERYVKNISQLKSSFQIRYWLTFLAR